MTTRMGPSNGRLLIGLLLWIATCRVDGYLTAFPHPSRSAHRLAQTRLRQSKSDEEGDSTTWLESLKARQAEIDQQEQERLKKWRKAKCTSSIAAVLPDWVRRLDVAYPLAACGSSSGTIYVVNLERNEVIANSGVADDDVDEETTKPERLEETLRLLYGSYDGGGTISIALSETLICEAPRTGGVRLWGLDTGSDKLVSLGALRALEGTLVTCLRLDEDYLWVGTSDGRLEAYSLLDDTPLSLQTKPELKWDLGSTVLSLTLCAEIGCAAATTSSGSVVLLSTEDEDTPVGSFYPPFDSTERKSTNIFATAVSFVPRRILDSKDDKWGYSVVCGGNDGSLYLQPLQMISEDEVDTDEPFTKTLRQLTPRHFGAVKGLASPSPGLLVSCGHDGTMRVWDTDDRSHLYQFVGYKVWIGSLWTDGVRIVSDGADNTLIMHDFDREPKAKESET